MYITINCLGPETWGNDYHICGTGERQSPINLTPMNKKRGNVLSSMNFSDAFLTENTTGYLFQNGKTGKPYVVKLKLKHIVGYVILEESRNSLV